jgi:hypothetical protein
MASTGTKTARYPEKTTPAFRAKSEGPGNRPRHERNSAHGPLFRPGDAILESGIYEVIHDNAHRTAHEVVLISRDRFPSCDTCTDRVRFKLVRTAPYIFQDADFEETE